MTLERHHRAKGFRRSLFEWGARHGAFFHPEQQLADFEVKSCEQRPESRLLKINLVFETSDQRSRFCAEVDGMLAHGWDKMFVRAWPPALEGNPKSLHHALEEFEIPRPPQPLRRVLNTDYAARDEEAEPPADSPNPEDIYSEQSSSKRPLDISADDGLFKRTRIENDLRFQGDLNKYERAHIIPKRVCSSWAGIDDLFWLADSEDNLWALSHTLHTAFDGSGGGKGVHPESQAMVAFQPLSAVDENQSVKIPLRAWCRTKHVAETLVRYIEPQILITGVQMKSDILYVVHGSGLATHGSTGERVIPNVERLGTEVRGAIPLWPSSIDRVEAQSCACGEATFKTLKGNQMAGWEIMWACLRWNFHAKICGEWKVLASEGAASSGTQARLEHAKALDESMNSCFAAAFDKTRADADES